MFSPLAMAPTLFLLAMFFIRIPAIYFVSQNLLFNTQVFAIILILGLSFFYFLQLYHRKIEFFAKRVEMMLIIIYLLTQSLSILGAINTQAYLSVYIKLILGILVFILARYFINNDKNFSQKTAIILIAGFTVAIAVQLVLLFFPYLYQSMASLFLNPNLFTITISNYKIGKLLDDTFMEAVIPILFFEYVRIKSKFRAKKLLLLTFIILGGFISFASNFRYRALAFTIGIFFSIALTSNIKKRVITIILLIILLLAALYIGDSIIKSDTGFTVLERLAVQDQSRDLETIQWRLKMYELAGQMAVSTPFGVGLGNFLDTLNAERLLSNITPQTDIRTWAIRGGTHNIFFQTAAETGLPGLFSLIALLCYYVATDIKLLKKKAYEKRTFIVSFWVLIFITQFFPAFNLPFYTTFFLLRGII